MCLKVMAWMLSGGVGFSSEERAVWDRHPSGRDHGHAVLQLVLHRPWKQRWVPPEMLNGHSLLW